jgi:hypothetical protein
MQAHDITFPGADQYPRWIIPAAAACGLPFFIFFAHYGNPLRGFVAFLSAASIAVVIITLWNAREFAAFWLAVVANLIFHIAIVAMIQGSDSHFPGVIFAPVLIADFLVWQLLTVTAVRVFKW